MTTEKKSGKGCVIGVVLLAFAFGAFAVIGILAAIAVPAFMRYTQASKVVEAKLTIAKIKSSVMGFYLKECKFPQNAVSSALPSNGATVVPDFSKGGWKEIGMTSSPSMFFRYRMINEGTTLKVIADADFSTNNPEAHTLTMIMTSGPDCSVDAKRGKTINEFK